MTFDIGLHEVCVRVGVRYVITKFSRMDSLPNFLTHGAPLRARESSAIITQAHRSRRSSETHQVTPESLKTFRIVQQDEVSLPRVANFGKR